MISFKMSIRVAAVIIFCFYSFGGCVIYSRARNKRQNLSVSERNSAITFFNNCTCMYDYQCDLDGLIITDGKPLGVVSLEQSTKKKEDGVRRILCIGGQFEGELVCCKYKPGDEDKPPVITQQPVSEAYTRSTLPLTETIAWPTVPQQKVCGRPLPGITIKIFNDEDEVIPLHGEFPWLVAIFKQDTGSQQWKFHASGSLIHPDVILTSNHVVVSAIAHNLKVIANGRIELSQIGDNPLHERNVKEIIKHPNYNSGTLYNDVSLLLLDKPYDLAGPPALNTLCLNPNISYENKRCLVAGWGRSAIADGSRTKVLRKVEVPTHSHSKCHEMLVKALNKSNYIFHESLMCAGGERGKGVCTGDGGSPLMCSTEDHAMYQVGVVAWGRRCGEEDVPGMYANVQFLYNWIVDQLKERDIYL